MLEKLSPTIEMQNLELEEDYPISHVVSYKSNEETDIDRLALNYQKGHLVNTRSRSLETEKNIMDTNEILENLTKRSLPDLSQDDGSSLLDILPCLNPNNPSEYEYPLCECFCLELYWAPLFAKLMKRLFRLKMKSRSKKGTPSYRNRNQKKQSKLAKSMGNMAAGVRRKSVKVKKAISREWRERMPMWNYQDSAIQEMELELQILRKQIREAGTQNPQVAPTRYQPDTSFTQYLLSSQQKFPKSSSPGNQQLSWLNS